VSHLELMGRPVLLLELMCISFVSANAKRMIAHHLQAKAKHIRTENVDVHGLFNDFEPKTLMFLGCLVVLNRKR
jgi:hypothetical protein